MSFVEKEIDGQGSNANHNNDGQTEDNTHMISASQPYYILYLDWPELMEITRNQLPLFVCG